MQHPWIILDAFSITSRLTHVRQRSVGSCKFVYDSSISTVGYFKLVTSNLLASSNRASTTLITSNLVMWGVVFTACVVFLATYNLLASLNWHLQFVGHFKLVIYNCSPLQTCHLQSVGFFQTGIYNLLAASKTCHLRSSNIKLLATSNLSSTSPVFKCIAGAVHHEWTSLYPCVR